MFAAPISTTQTITAAILGVGATKRLSAVRWGVAGNILVAWVLTIPAAALVAAVCYWVIRPFLGIRRSHRRMPRDFGPVRLGRSALPPGAVRAEDPAVYYSDAAARRPDAEARPYDPCRPPEVAAFPATFSTAAWAAARAAPALGQPARWRLRLRADGAGLQAELHAEPSRCPTVDPIGRGRAIAGGAALRNVELAVTNLGHEPRVRLLPDQGDPLHLATVTMGDRDGERPDPTERLLHRAMQHRRSHRLPFEPRPVQAALYARLHEAARRDVVRTLPVDRDRLRTVGTVLAAAIVHRREGEDQLADLAQWLPDDAWQNPRAGRAALIERLGRGALLLVSTEADRPPDWLQAGWALQNTCLTAVSNGLAVSVVGGVLDAPGVRAALASRLRLDGCPQVLLRAGWPERADPAPRQARLLAGAGLGLR